MTVRSAIEGIVGTPVPPRQSPIGTPLGDPAREPVVMTPALPESTAAPARPELPDPDVRVPTTPTGGAGFSRPPATVAAPATAQFQLPKSPYGQQIDDIQARLDAHENSPQGQLAAMYRMRIGDPGNARNLAEMRMLRQMGMTRAQAWATQQKGLADRAAAMDAPHQARAEQLAALQGRRLDLTQGERALMAEMGMTREQRAHDRLLADRDYAIRKQEADRLQEEVMRRRTQEDVQIQEAGRDRLALEAAQYLGVAPDSPSALFLRDTMHKLLGDQDVRLLNGEQRMKIIQEAQRHLWVRQHPKKLAGTAPEDIIQEEAPWYMRWPGIAQQRLRSPTTGETVYTDQYPLFPGI